MKIEVPKCTIYQNIFNRNHNYPKDIAINYFGNKICYSALFDYTEQCAKSLKQIGIKRGDCVTLCTAGVPEAIYLVLACSRIGATANFINPLFTKEQMVERINETEAKWIFVLDEMYSLIEAAITDTCIDKIVIIPVTNSVSPIAAKALYLKSKARGILSAMRDSSQEHLSWKEFSKIGKSYKGHLDSEYEPDTTAVMVYSSGSPGASKGIMLTNDGINATVMNYRNSGFRVDRGDSFLQIIPVWFSTGIIMSMMMPLYMGMTVIPEPRFSNETFVADLKRYKPSITLAATNMWLYTINTKEMHNADLSNMKYPITGGEKVLPIDEDRVNQFLSDHGCKHKFYKGYGMCELGSTISGSTDAVDCPDKQGSSGYPILNAVVKACDIDTEKELKYGEHGEIRVSSLARMKGYYKNSKATAEFFKTDDSGTVWACTGDIGYIDEDGEVFILGRATDCYKNNEGKTVFLFDIENEIFQEEAVNQCKVVDIKENNVTKLVAHIVFRQGTDAIEDKLNTIHNRLKESFPAYMQPDYYKIRELMPVNSNGKRDVEALRDDREGLISKEQLRQE